MATIITSNAIFYPQFIATQGVGFVIDVAGAAVLLDYSTLNSSVQPIIRDSMRRLIMSSSSPESSTVLKMIQENVSKKPNDQSKNAPFEYMYLLYNQLRL